MDDFSKWSIDVWVVKLSNPTNDNCLPGNIQIYYTWNKLKTININNNIYLTDLIRETSRQKKHKHSLKQLRITIQLYYIDACFSFPNFFKLQATLNVVITFNKWRNGNSNIFSKQHIDLEIVGSSLTIYSR